MQNGHGILPDQLSISSGLSHHAEHGNFVIVDYYGFRCIALAIDIKIVSSPMTEKMFINSSSLYEIGTIHVPGLY